MRKLGPSSFEGLLFPPIISHCNGIENTCKVLRKDKVSYHYIYFAFGQWEYEHSIVVNVKLRQC